MAAGKQNGKCLILYRHGLIESVANTLFFYLKSYDSLTNVQVIEAARDSLVMGLNKL